MHSKQKGQVQVASRHEGQVQMHLRQSGQVVLGRSRLTGQVLAFRRPTRQVTVPLMNQMGQMRQVQAPSSRTEQVSALICQVLAPDIHTRQVLSSSSQMNDLLLPRIKNVLVPKKQTGQIEKDIIGPGQAHYRLVFPLRQRRQAIYQY